MKDTVIKGTGTSRKLKAPATMPETFDEWRSQLLAGTATMDISLNPAGCDVVGTALTKETLLKDATKTALELEQPDPTVDDALYALSQKTQPAVLNVHTSSGVTVTATKGGTVLTATANGSGLAVLYPAEFGTWTLKATINGKQITLLYVIDAIAVFDVTLTTNLQDASWDFISAISEQGTAASIWKVGDKKNIKVDGVTYSAQIIGFAHDNKSTGGKAGITFQLVDCLNTTARMNTINTNYGGWNNSAMRTSTLSYIWGQLDEDLQKVIKPVNKLSGTGGGSTSGTKTTSDKLFLLSEIEIFGTATYSVDGEGTQYAWYKAGNSRIKKVNGSANKWWERSPYSGSTSNFCFLFPSGNASADDASSSFGVSFGFCV